MVIPDSMMFSPSQEVVKVRDRNIQSKFLENSTEVHAWNIAVTQVIKKVKGRQHGIVGLLKLKQNKSYQPYVL